MQGIQHFFSGFILLKVPFPLTAGFKSMFQRGLAAELPDLDSSYVSSVSWYFLVMYGLRSFFRLVLGEPSLETREQQALLMRMGMAPPSNNPSQSAPDGQALAKQLRQEAENWEMMTLFPSGGGSGSELDTVEKRLLGKKRYPKRSNLGLSGGVSAADQADLLLSSSKKSKSSSGSGGKGTSSSKKKRN